MSETSELEDCQRIVRIFKAHGQTISIEEAGMIWESISEDCCAGWLVLPPLDEQVWKMINDE